MLRGDSWRAAGRDRGDRDHDRDRDRAGNGFRPPSPRRGSPPRHDAWRPSDGRDRRDRGYGHDAGSSSHRPSHRETSRPPGPSRHADAHRAGPQYPRPPQSDFTFHVAQPPRIAPFSFPPAATSNRRADRAPRGLPRKPPRPRWQPAPHPSERALISAGTFRQPTQRIYDPSATAKFRNLDEMSDDEETPMDMSSQSSQSGAENPAKRARTDAQPDADADAVPAWSEKKWSNPDPYTALPCPDESTRKKRDIVKLIRKARVEAVKPNTETPPKGEDYLAFVSSDEEDEPPPPPPLSSLPPRPPPPRSPPDTKASSNSGFHGTSTHDASGPLGSRKRTFDDEIRPPDYGQMNKAPRGRRKGVLVPDWQPKDGEEACPWKVTGSDSHSMTARLHKEVLDFYDYVRPRQFEQRIRTQLVEHIRKAMQRDGRNFASAQVYPFGSFMSGLYLPTADMDLVVCSASFTKGGPPVYLGAKNWLYKFKTLLVNQGIAEAASINVIAHARIPLVKFVDKRTGLKVDVSFENMGGVKAVDTFLQWRREYPAMPVLVTVVKHFLLMRGLNEPVHGGIGGFSVICLVVSMLQLMPQLQGRGVADDDTYFGVLLLEFFDLYGCHFHHKTNAISLTSPVGYVRKSEVSSFTYRNSDRLSIIDPNNPANDIAGGSSNTVAILDSFYDAFHDLRDRMRALRRSPDRQGGILDAILGGNYSSFRMQRRYLKHVHQETIGPCTDEPCSIE